MLNSGVRMLVPYYIVDLLVASGTTDVDVLGSISRWGKMILDFSFGVSQ